MKTSGIAVMENVRRYRTIASLYRQTAAFRPLLRHSLLQQAEEWERLAMTELDAYFTARRATDRAPSVCHGGSEMLAA